MKHSLTRMSKGKENSSFLPYVPSTYFKPFWVLTLEFYYDCCTTCVREELEHSLNLSMLFGHCFDKAEFLVLWFFFGQNSL